MENCQQAANKEIIKESFDKVRPAGMPVLTNDFRVLFKAYNERNKVKLSPSCLSCYAKVYFYFKNYFKNKESAK